MSGRANPGVPRALEVAIRGRTLGLPTMFSTDGATNHVYVPPSLASVHTIHYEQLCRRGHLVAEPFYWLERFGIAPRTCDVCRRLVAAVLAAACSPARTRSGK